MTKVKAEAEARPSWPTIEEQLVASKVIYGSALEALVRANQDFGILSPEEANDDLPFPPWLRVYIRKTHPELPFTGPRVVYPLFVNEIHSWMRKNQDLGAAPRSSTKNTAR